MWICKKCKEEIEDQFEVCWNCGSDKKGAVALNKDGQVTEYALENFNKDKQVNKNELESSKSKYPALRTIVVICKVFAFIIGIAAVIIAIVCISQGQAGAMTGIIFLLIGALIVIGLIAVSELIKVFIDIEYNTRQASKRK